MTVENFISSFPSIVMFLEYFLAHIVPTKHLLSAFLEAIISFYAKLRNDMFSFPLQMAIWPQSSHLV